MSKELHDSSGRNSCGLFVCLFVCDFTRIFYTYGDVTITGVGLQILTDAWHSLPLSCEAPLACHTYCDTGIRLYWSFPRTRDTHTYCRSISNGAVTTVFTTTVCRGWVSNTQPSACGPNALTRCATYRRGLFWYVITYNENAYFSLHLCHYCSALCRLNWYIGKMSIEFLDVMFPSAFAED